MNYDFPKIDLHCHLDGAISAETMFRLAKAREIETGASTPEELRPMIMCDASCRSVNEYLKKFELPTKILQDKEALSAVAYELTEQLDEQGLAYAEIRFAPQLHTHKGLSQKEAIEAVEAGVRLALEEQMVTIKIGVILCAMAIGDSKLNREANLETARLVCEMKNDIVRGFDLAGAEGLCPLSDYAELFDMVRANNVPFTCHAGDSQGPDTVRTAICAFKAKRIGHGHHIYEDKELCEIAKKEGVTLEICLTSNIQCETQPSFQEHPAKKLLDMGVNVTLNTDNPVIAGVTLCSEYDTAIEKCGFTYLDLIKMNLISAKSSFLEEKEKQKLVDTLTELLEND